MNESFLRNNGKQIILTNDKKPVWPNNAFITPAAPAGGGKKPTDPVIFSPDFKPKSKLNGYEMNDWPPHGDILQGQKQFRD